MTVIDKEMAKRFVAKEPETDAERVRVVAAFLFAVGPTVGMDYSDSPVTADLLRIADRLEELDGTEPAEGDLVDSNEAVD